MTLNARPTLQQRLAEYFAAHPDVWVDGRQLSKVAGFYAYRTRISEIRRRGMDIENRVRTVTTASGSKFRISEYKYRQARRLPFEVAS
jgi:hypothetical protein